MEAIAAENGGCVVCLDRPAISHEHHTVPRSRGGEDSLRIVLCPTCHNSIHANALYLVAQIRRNKIRPPKQFWRSSEDETRVQPYLEILVKSLLSPILERVDRPHILTTLVDTKVFEDVKVLQMDLALSSMEKTLDYCINFVLESRGLSHASRKSKKESSMWFLRKPVAK